MPSAHHTLQTPFKPLCPPPHMAPFRCRVSCRWRWPSWGAWSACALVSSDHRPALALRPHCACPPVTGWVVQRRVAWDREGPRGQAVSCAKGASDPSFRPGAGASGHRRGEGGPWDQVALAGEPETSLRLLEARLRGLPHPPAVGAHRGALPGTVSEPGACGGRRGCPELPGAACSGRGGAARSPQARHEP